MIMRNMGRGEERVQSPYRKTNVGTLRTGDVAVTDMS